MKIKMTGLFIPVMAALISLSATQASAGQRVVVEKNHSMRISLGGSAGSVIVANPDIADVQVIDSRTIYIVGKGFGNSSVTITDRSGHALFDGEIVVTAGPKGAVNVYKGLKSTLMDCSSVCTAVDAETTPGFVNAMPTQVASGMTSGVTSGVPGGATGGNGM
ncbi:MAG: pilus assembly protein N-terminal domain-containing protein [Asticcacaulis sp.]